MFLLNAAHKVHEVYESSCHSQRILLCRKTQNLRARGGTYMRTCGLLWPLGSKIQPSGLRLSLQCLDYYYYNICHLTMCRSCSNHTISVYWKPKTPFKQGKCNELHEVHAVYEEHEVYEPSCYDTRILTAGYISGIHDDTTTVPTSLRSDVTVLVIEIDQEPSNLFHRRERDDAGN